MVMEFMGGQTLKKCIASKPLPEALGAANSSRLGFFLGEIPIPMFVVCLGIKRHVFRQFELLSVFLRTRAFHVASKKVRAGSPKSCRR
jgi:hypothetical protein